MPIVQMQPKPTGTPQTVLDVPLFGQQTNSWCWAASGQMIMSYHGTSVSQCAQASYRFGIGDCCDTPTPAACVHGGLPNFGHWGFSFQTTPMGTALSFSQLTAQVDAELPVAFAWRWPQGGGHMMVADGVWSTFLGPLVHRNNPEPVGQGDEDWITYAFYVSQPGSHTHGLDYYNVAPASGSPAAPAFAAGENRDAAEDVEGAAPRFGVAQAAADAAVRVLAALPAASGAAGADASGLALAEPLRVLYVWQDALAGYEPGADPRPLLAEVGELLYPVTDGGAVVGAVRVVELEEGWAVKSVGEPRMAAALAAVRAADAAASGTAPSEYFIVHVPSLYEVFVARTDAAGALVLLPVHDDPARGFVRGEARPGDDYLIPLVPDARAGRSAVVEGAD